VRETERSVAEKTPIEPNLGPISPSGVIFREAQASAQRRNVRAQNLMREIRERRMEFFHFGRTIKSEE